MHLFCRYQTRIEELMEEEDDRRTQKKAKIAEVTFAMKVRLLKVLDQTNYFVNKMMFHFLWFLF